MKKLFFIAVAVMALAGSAISQTFVARSFLADNQAVWLTNLTTTTYADIGVPFTNAVGGAVYSLTNLYSTNSLIAPGTLYTNSNVYYGQAWYDVQGFSDRNGNNASASISLYGVGSTTRSTNTLTLTFVKMQKLVNNIPTLASTDAQSQFVVAITPNGTTAIGVTTNVPTAFMQGAAGIRLKTIVSADDGAAGGFYLQSATLGGYSASP